MKTPKRPVAAGKSATKTQADKFRDLAREVGADDSDEGFKAKLAKIAKAPH